ncbi:MAG: hypothetical protein ACREH5_06195 [Candidatus Omnitrophota bacterium]
MIVTMQGSTSIAANASNSGILTGQKYERPPFQAIGTLYITGSATGLFAEINVDGLAVSDEVTVGAQNRVPVIPDDLLIAGWEAPMGGLIQLKVRNSTGGALTTFWKILLEAAELGGQPAY